MIVAKLTYASNDLKQVEVSGHAFYNKIGADIVCAACSFLIRTVMRYYQQSNQLEDCQIEEGYVGFVLKESCKDGVAELLELGLSDLKSEFPHNIELIRKRI
jgi:uncharacterized protein YsxB (DUF464 family)